MKIPSSRFWSVQLFRMRDIRKKCFTQIYRDLYGDAMLVPIQIKGTSMEVGN